PRRVYARASRLAAGQGRRIKRHYRLVNQAHPWGAPLPGAFRDWFGSRVAEGAASAVCNSAPSGQAHLDVDPDISLRQAWRARYQGGYGRLLLAVAGKNGEKPVEFVEKRQ